MFVISNGAAQNCSGRQTAATVLRSHYGRVPELIDSKDVPLKCTTRAVRVVVVVVVLESDPRSGSVTSEM